MAAISRVGSIKKYFTALKDPRVRQRTEHRLIDIIAIALCGVIANCDGWTDIIDFANSRIAWFQRFLKDRPIVVLLSPPGLAATHISVHFELRPCRTSA